MTDFAFTASWWGGILLFGASLLLSILEWRGVVRTPFEKLWPATAMGVGFSSGLCFLALIALAIGDVLELRFSGLPFATPAIIVLVGSLLVAASLTLAFMRKPPSWAVPKHLKAQANESTASNASKRKEQKNG